MDIETNGGRCNHMAVAKTYTPKQLAAEIGVDPKVLRAYLRKNHTRTLEAKNTTWIIPESVAKAARKSFEKNVATEAK
jgi:predicted site-specific integrase-resolvase